MRPILVVYASRNGHTRHIAERVADRVRTLCHEAQIQDARTEALPALERYSAVIMAASVHLGHHEREMVKFVRARRPELVRVPTLLLSVSLTEAAAADVHRPDAERLDARRATRKAIEDFVLETGWRADRAVSVAGAVTDTAYGPLTRVLMRKIIHRDVPEEPARQVVFTDWAALNSEVDALVGNAAEHGATSPAATPGPLAFSTAVDGAILAP